MRLDGRAGAAKSPLLSKVNAATQLGGRKLYTQTSLLSTGRPAETHHCRVSRQGVRPAAAQIISVSRCKSLRRDPRRRRILRLTFSTIATRL
jgi:hypothetical protein